MNELTKNLVDGILNEDKQEVVALYAGGFKPPTSGHFQVVEEALKQYPEIDKLIVLVGSGVRDGIEQAESILVWEIYQNYLPMKVEIQAATKPPIRAVYSYAGDNPGDTIYWILGARDGKDEDLSDIATRTAAIDKAEDKYNNVEVKIIKTSDASMSGTNARKTLLSGNREAFYQYLPSQVEEKEEIFNILRPAVKETADPDDGKAAPFGSGYKTLKELEDEEIGFWAKHADIFSVLKKFPNRYKELAQKLSGERKIALNYFWDNYFENGEALLNENASYSKDIDIKAKIDQLTQHMIDKGYNIEPLPTLKFVDGDSENARDFFGTTAYYDPNNQTIVLYTEGRHPKDIVRSYAHEMIHHIQNLEGRLGNITTTNTQEDDYLNDIEAEANLKGTMTFRNWTDSLNENLSKNTNQLYHWTSYSACKKIIESNKLKSNKSSQFFEYDESRDLPEYENVVFFTIENERFADEETSNQCILVVDKSKLSKDYKVISYGDPYEETVVYTNDPSIPILPYLKGVLLMNTLQQSAVKKMVEFLESKGIPYEINDKLERKVKDEKAKLPTLKKELVNKLKLKYPNGFIGYLNTLLLPSQTPKYFQNNPTYSYPSITINKPGEYGGKNKFQVKFKIEPQNLEKYINWFMYSPDSIKNLINIDNYEGKELNLKGDIPIDTDSLNEIGDASAAKLEWDPAQIEKIAKNLERRIAIQEDDTIEYYDMSPVISVISYESRTRYRVTVDASVDKPEDGLAMITLRVDFTTEEGGDDIINKGEQYKILATLTDIIIQLITRVNEIDSTTLDLVKFYAKDDTEGKYANPDSKRGKLYQAFINKNLSKLPGNWQMSISDEVIMLSPSLNEDGQKTSDKNMDDYKKSNNPSGKVSDPFGLNAFAYELARLGESDPKKGTGKKPKGSSRRLYTDEDPKDTVGIKFSTRQDIVDTLNKTSFKNKSHARQSQIINLIHQRVRAAYERAKDPETKARLKRGLDYIEKRKEMSKKKTERLKKLKEGEGGVDTSWTGIDNETITLQDILELTKDIKIQNFPTKELTSIVLNWDNNPEEIERISQVEVSSQYPILIMVDEQNKIQWILDGNHRAQKALRAQAETIPAKLIKPSNLNSKAKKILLGIIDERLKKEKLNEQKQDMKFKVPKLNYSYTSLQPYIDKETMEEHFDKHFKGYTDKLNAELDEKSIRVNAEDQIQAIQIILGKYSKNNTIRNNGGGFYNHVLYFENMTPDYKAPSAKFKKMLEENFNSFSEFKEQFKEAGLKQFGSGWVFLIKKGNKLVIESYANQDNPYLDKDFKGEILIAMDVWEHSYYLKHKSQRGNYINDFFRVVDYKVAEDRLKEEPITENVAPNHDGKSAPFGSGYDKVKEGDTIEKYSAKGKKTGKLKQGTVRARLNIPKDEKIPISKINKELSRLKKMDQDDDKKGVQLGDKNQKYYKALLLAKTLKTTTNVNEGAYDSLVTQLTKTTINKWVEDSKKKPIPKKSFVDIDIDKVDGKGREIEFNYVGLIEFTNKVDGYEVDGTSNAGEEDDKFPFIATLFKVNPKVLPQAWSKISADVSDVIRHEIEHLTQTGDNLRTGKYMDDDIQLRDLINKAKILPQSDYYKLEKEVDAMLQGLYLKAKKTKKPFKDVIKNYLDIAPGLEAKEDKELILNLWRSRRRALSLPVFENEEKVMDYKIFLDMDGVLVDFDRQFEEAFGMPPREFKEGFGTEMFWKKIEERGVGFWRGMEWMPGGQELYNRITQHDHYLLSSPSKSNTSKIGKHMWKKDNTPNTKLILSRSYNKKNYADKSNILIDDREDNIQQWVSAGGIGILYKSAEQVNTELDKLGL